MEFWSGIRGGYNQWQAGPRYRFIQPQRVERDKEVVVKGCIKVAKVRRRVCIRM